MLRVGLPFLLPPRTDLDHWTVVGMNDTRHIRIGRGFKYSNLLHAREMIALYYNKSQLQYRTTGAGGGVSVRIVSYRIVSVRHCIAIVTHAPLT